MYEVWGGTGRSTMQEMLLMLILCVNVPLQKIIRQCVQLKLQDHMSGSKGIYDLLYLIVFSS